ncbi:DUF373 family protein [Candidatus Micrarchaeota archaeon]|nr:DUF373 family protein [Candidatus Micrarchaeota archaeon]
MKGILILSVDRDNDLFEKAKISGPIIGREANLNAANKLALADPQDTDANAIFQAVKKYDELGKDYEVQIVTLTGNKKLGYEADKTIANQLDKILQGSSFTSCVLVTDGQHDEEIIPILKSRIKIDSAQIVVMKQAKELEKTYVVLLEKLKDPYYARIILGIPALLLIMFALSSYMNWGWEPVAIVIALFLLMRLFGIDEYIVSTSRHFNFSVENSSFVIYLSAFAIILVSFWTTYQTYSINFMEFDAVKILGMSLQSLMRLLPWGLLLLVIGKVFDAYKEGKKIKITKYGAYMTSIMLFWLIFSVGADWVVNISPPYVSFGDFILVILISLILGYICIYVIHKIKVDIVSRLKLEDKEVINEYGSFIGTVVGVDKKKSILIVQSPFGQKKKLNFDLISEVNERIIVK